jgi:class 3 adenylate cyclase/predicted ATPase
VLFADIRGSLELIEGSDPERAQELLDSAISAMMEAVHRYEGTVNKVLGDGIMALFGAPLAHEDHAVRACYAALAMQEAIRRSAEEVRRTYGVEIQVRVGLNSGDVVVRAIGNDLTMDYDAIGQTTHLAGRMEQLAVPGTIRLSGDTLQLAEGFIQVKALGPIPVKGLNDPVEVFELVGTTATRTRFQAAVARGLTRFVGRQTELEALNHALARAADGRGQIVALIGEPGVGKSRLFYEFTHSHRIQGWLILESGSVSYGKATAYLPIIDMLKDYFRIEDRDEARGIREKVTGKLLTLDEALKPLLVAFLALLDVPADDAAWEALDPSERRRRTLEATKGLLLRESRVQPVVLVFEDLHWIDSETQVFLNSLVDSLPTVRILLLVNYRPEFGHRWGSKSYYAQRRIDPLPTESSEELLATLLGEDAGLAPLKQMLVERTGGNPFFLEESVRTLVETGALIGASGAYQVAASVTLAEVPATVQGVLAARIDRLPAEDKQLLQMAAVIGKDVSYSLLQAIAETPEQDLWRSLTNLQAAEFIYETRLFPSSEYTFKHALTHEVTYGSMLRERRRELHQAIARAIESQFAGRLAEQFERLAHHYTEAGVNEQAVGYWQQAGQRALERCVNIEAVAHFTNGLELIESLPDTANRSQQELTIQLGLGVGLVALKGAGASEVGRTYVRARELCQQVGEPAEQCAALWGLWRYQRTQVNFRSSLELAEEFSGLAQRQNDPALMLQAHHSLWTTQFYVGEFVGCREHTEQGIALYDPREHHAQTFRFGGHDPCVCGHAMAAFSLWLLGYPDQTVARLEDALGLAHELHHPPSLALALEQAAYLHQLRREDRLAKERAEISLELAAEQGFGEYAATATLVHGYAVAEAGQVEEGIAEMRKALASRRAQGRKVEEPHVLASFVEILAKAGQSEQGMKVLAEAFVAAEDRGMTYWDAELHRLKGVLLSSLSQRKRSDAETCFQKAIEVARRQSAKSLELRAAASLARLHFDQGQTTAARDLLAPIYNWFTEGLDTPDLRDAKGLLDQSG